MSTTVRLATRADAPLWLDLLRDTLGLEYPSPEAYDLGWVANELSLQTEQPTWVVEGDGSLLASISLLRADPSNANPVANLGRCLFRPDSFADGSAAALTHHIVEWVTTRGRMAVTRVPLADDAQQNAFERGGFFCAGYQPWKHLLPARMSILFYVLPARPVLGTRVPLSESLPQVTELGTAVLDALKISQPLRLCDGTTGYPLRSDLQFEELPIEHFEVWKEQSASAQLPTEISTGYHRGLGLLRIEQEGHSRTILARREGNLVAGISYQYDVYDRCVRILEGFTTDDISLGALIQHMVHLARANFSAAYVEIDVLLSAPRLLKTVEQLGFVPVAYFPAFALRQDRFTDVVKLVKLNVAFDQENPPATPQTAAIFRMTSDYFADQTLGVAIINLLRGLRIFEGLGDGELRKLARLFSQRLFRAGETIFRKGDAGTEAFVVLRGQIDICLENPPRPIASVSSGHVFGEQAFLEGAPRTATAIASQPTILLTVQRTAFTELIQREPSLGMVVMTNIALDLSAKLRRATAASNSTRREA